MLTGAWVPASELTLLKNNVLTRFRPFHGGDSKHSLPLLRAVFSDRRSHNGTSIHDELFCARIIVSLAFCRRADVKTAVAAVAGHITVSCPPSSALCFLTFAAPFHLFLFPVFACSMVPLLLGLYLPASLFLCVLVDGMVVLVHARSLSAQCARW